MIKGRGAGRHRLDIDNMYICGSSFTRVSLEGSTFRDTQLMDVATDGANAAGLSARNANLCNASCRDVNFSGATIRQANLTELAIAEAKLTGMTINGTRVTDLLSAYGAKASDGKEDR